MRAFAVSPSGQSFDSKDLLHGGRRNTDAGPLQLADDTLIAPPRILPGKPHDQRSNLRRDGWSTRWTRIGPTLRDDEPGQRRSVAGVTTNADQWMRGNSRLAADRNTRSVVRNAGCRTCRRSSADWWRRTTISWSFDAVGRNRRRASCRTRWTAM
jgi:hypothetical protein